MKKLTLLFTVSFSVLQVKAVNDFQKFYGGAYDEDLKHIAKSSDGGCLLAGSTMSFGSGATDAYLTKTDSLGTVLWTKTYGGPDDDYLEWVETTHEHGLILCGYTFSVSTQHFEITVIKTDSLGDIQWQKKIHLSDVARAYCIRETVDHGFVLCGEEDSTGADGNLLIVKLDSLGDVVWNKSFGIPVNADIGRCIIQTKDDGFAVCGYSRYGINASYAVVLKTDANGNLDWSKYYFNSNPSYNRSYPNQIFELVSDNYIIAGSSYLVGQPQNNILLFSLDSAGAERWSNLYSTGAWDGAEGLMLLPEQSGFLIYGHTSSPVSGVRNALIFKTDLNGNYLWNECYGNDSMDSQFISGILREGNGVYLAGTSNAFGAGSQDIFMVGRDTTMNSSICYNHSVVLLTTPFPLTNNGPAIYHPLSIATTNLTFSTASGGQTSLLCLGTGINETEENAGIYLYPNPGNQDISFDNPGHEKLMRITLMDHLGRRVWIRELNSNEESIQIKFPYLNAGIYWFEITTSKSRVVKKYVAG